MIPKARNPIQYEIWWFLGLGAITTLIAFAIVFWGIETWNPIALVMLVMSFGLVFLPSTLVIFSVIFIAGRYLPGPRAAGFSLAVCSPALVLLIFYLLPKPPDPINQSRNTPSPSGSYMLDVTIEKSSVPKYSDYHVWKIGIRNLEGSTVYKDDESTMLGHFNIYWGWDETEDTVWVYNSDDGRITKWTSIDGAWNKKTYSDAPDIPAYILPDYAKK